MRIKDFIEIRNEIRDKASCVNSKRAISERKTTAENTRRDMAFICRLLSASRFRGPGSGRKREDANVAIFPISETILKRGDIKEEGITHSTQKQTY